ncbi:MAG: alpha-glucan family phosphorylase [Myxococcota bacterium]
MLPNVLRPLNTLAENLWWSWQPGGHELFETIDPQRWNACHHNPVALLQAVEWERFEELASDAAYVARVQAMADALNAYLAEQGWCASRPEATPRIAYFSMEFGLHTSLKTYSGGLGVLAGDHLKSASDLGVPLVGISLFYGSGYFRQVIDDGQQLSAYPTARPDRLPLQPIMGEDGKRLMVHAPIGREMVAAQVWRLQVGRCRLYLLDTNHEGNPAHLRAITSQLYGGGDTMRIRQETLLGLGGVALLRALNETVDVYHLNEGHCAFVPLALLREHTDRGVPWASAMEQVKNRCVFTTHTPVPAGHDRFSYELVSEVLGPWRTAAGWLEGTIMDLGRVDPGDWSETLCMTVLALRLSHIANGVSMKHGEVSREMWHCMWPDRAVEDVPIGHVTNGVHPWTWMSAEAQALFDAHLVGWRERLWDRTYWEDAVNTIPDEAWWELRTTLRTRLTTTLAKRTGVQLDPTLLTIGFARRFASYKRGDLLYSDAETLHRLLQDLGPFQVIYSGKAHPADKLGQAVLQRVLEFTEDLRFRGRVLFVEDYDMDVGAALTRGVDVWLNNPRRPKEASGTSGQKVTFNAGLNLSVLDGWWLEGFEGDNGFAIGGAEVIDDVEAMDASDAASLYEQLEHKLLPLWNDKDASGRPTGWIDAIRRSTASCLPAYNSHRMVRDYVENIYRIGDSNA